MSNLARVRSSLINLSQRGGFRKDAGESHEIAKGGEEHLGILRHSAGRYLHGLTGCSQPPPFWLGESVPGCATSWVSWKFTLMSSQSPCECGETGFRPSFPEKDLTWCRNCHQLQSRFASPIPQCHWDGAHSATLLADVIPQVLHRILRLGWSRPPLYTFSAEEAGKFNLICLIMVFGTYLEVKKIHKIGYIKIWKYSQDLDSHTWQVSIITHKAEGKKATNYIAYSFNRWRKTNLSPF